LAVPAAPGSEQVSDQVSEQVSDRVRIRFQTRGQPKGQQGIPRSTRGLPGKIITTTCLRHLESAPSAELPVRSAKQLEILMGFEKFLFYVFAAITVFSAGMVVTRRNPVHSVLYLVLAFVSSAVLWLLLEAEFLGIVLVLVYVGAVMVLFLFVVMMLDVDTASLRAQFIRHLPLGLIVAAVLVVNLFLVLGPSNFGLAEFAKPEAQPVGYSNTAELGMQLYTTYLFQFEIASIILLVAIIAAIRLTLRHRPTTKFLDPSAQVRVRKGRDRIRLVSMAPERIPAPVPLAPAQTEAQTESKTESKTEIKTEIKKEKAE
jgi:NADH-quinone oxidoreductase subunit J